jgi:small-conductance mechanosensitive channel
MAVSAYDEHGRLKKNALRGTSLAVDESRADERKRFGALHERAIEYADDREGFQQVIQQEQAAQDALNQKALEQAQAGLTSTSADFNRLRTRQSSLQDTLRRTEDFRRRIEEGANWKDMRGFLSSNPDIAAAASGAYGARTGKERDRYKKGKRAYSVEAEYQDLARQTEERLAQLKETNPELFAALQSGPSDVGNVGPKNLKAGDRARGSA